MIVLATFKGQNNSEGYKFGHIYQLMIVGNQIEALRKDSSSTTITGSSGTNRVTYGSVFSFLQNWEVLKQL